MLQVLHPPPRGQPLQAVPEQQPQQALVRLDPPLPLVALLVGKLAATVSGKSSSLSSETSSC